MAGVSTGRHFTPLLRATVYAAGTARLARSTAWPAQRNSCPCVAGNPGPHQQGVEYRTAIRGWGRPVGTFVDGTGPLRVYYRHGIAAHCQLCGGPSVREIGRAHV